MTAKAFFAEHGRAALAFSGGVDSAYLLYLAKQNGAEICAYYVCAQFQPAFEREDARRLARELAVTMKELPLDVLSVARVAENPPDRCYHCKQAIFGAIIRAAEADGYTEVFDGTNASDDASDRPGMRALSELHVLSPLRILGLTKDEIRRRSKEAGLFTWDKPAYACLATRIPSGMPITREALARTEAAEGALFEAGFSDFRVRTTKEGCALLQVTGAQMARAKAEWDGIRKTLLRWYPDAALDEVPRG